MGALAAVVYLASSAAVPMSMAYTKCVAGAPTAPVPLPVADEVRPAGGWRELTGVNVVRILLVDVYCLNRTPCGKGTTPRRQTGKRHVKAGHFQILAWPSKGQDVAKIGSIFLLVMTDITQSLRGNMFGTVIRQLPLRRAEN